MKNKVGTVLKVFSGGMRRDYFKSIIMNILLGNWLIYFLRQKRWEHILKCSQKEWEEIILNSKWRKNESKISNKIPLKNVPKSKNIHPLAYRKMSLQGIQKHNIKIRCLNFILNAIYHNLKIISIFVLHCNTRV